MSTISGVSTGNHPISPVSPQPQAPPAPAPAPASDPDHDGDVDKPGKLDVKA